MKSFERKWRRNLTQMIQPKWQSVLLPLLLMLLLLL